MTVRHRPTRSAAYLSPRWRKIWLTAHIATSVGWLGSAYTMLVLGLAALLSGRDDFRVAVYEIMHLFDRAVNIPLVLGMLTTGLVVSLRTKWGLFQHWWVSVKLVLSLFVVVGVPLLSVPRVLSMIEAVPAGTVTGSTAAEIVAISVGAITSLTTVTVISVFKPWGRIRGARARSLALLDREGTAHSVGPRSTERLGTARRRGKAEPQGAGG